MCIRDRSGLAARFTFAITRRARSVGQLFYGLTAVLLITALVIPSTSARAALLAPVYLAMTAAFQNERLNRALAIALPVNILLTAIGSLVGAGAHLVINDTLGQLVGSRFSFMEWLLLGLPFAAISAFGSTWMILRIFLTRQERSLRLTDHLQQQLAAPGAWTRQERYVGLVTLVLAALWMTETWHGIDNALVALMGALAVSLPPFGPLKFKDAAKAVEWEMILFVAASLALSEALVMSGAGRWLVDLLLVQSGLSSLESKLAILAGVAAITLTAHLYITSRSARGAALAPLIVLLALSLGIDPRIMAFVTAAGIGYCITLAVSAKPLTMFQQLGSDRPAYSAGDLARLSGVLAPFHLGLIVVFAVFYWPHLLPPLAAQPDQAAVQRTAAPATQPAPDQRDMSPANRALLQAEAAIAIVPPAQMVRSQKMATNRQAETADAALSPVPTAQPQAAAASRHAAATTAIVLPSLALHVPIEDAVRKAGTAVTTLIAMAAADEVKAAAAPGIAAGAASAASIPAPATPTQDAVVHTLFLPLVAAGSVDAAPGSALVAAAAPQVEQSGSATAPVPTGVAPPCCEGHTSDWADQDQDDDGEQGDDEQDDGEQDDDD